MAEKGLFVTFEGGEGAGKTTLIEDVRKELEKREMKVLVTREPGGTALGEKIRQVLLEPSASTFNPMTELLLFLAARCQHLDDVIAPALDNGFVVLCDRFNDSSIAYQGGARQLGIDTVYQISHLVLGGVDPDVTFYLDLDPEVGLARAKEVQKMDAPKGQSDRLENEHLTFHKKVRDAFLALCDKEPSRICKIDASKTPTEVYEQVMQRLQQKL